MWLIPSTSSPCVPASECSTSAYPPGSNISASPRVMWATVSGTPTPRPASWRGWKMRPWSQRLFSAETCATWTPCLCEAASISSAPDCPASRTARPASSADSQTTAATETATDRSHTSCESWPSVDPPWCSARTCLPGFAEDGFDLSAKSYADWVTSSLARSLSLRSRLAQATGGNECSSWPSPRAEDSESCGNHPSGSAAGQVSRGADRVEELLLGGQAKSWATPTARDHKGADRRRNCGASLPHQVETGQMSHSLPQGQAAIGKESTKRSGRRLNPAFVCWLMGAPWWWTRAEPISFAAAEMAVYRSRLRSHLSSLCGR